MTTLDRRLQLLLDQQMYERVAEEAARRGGSVNSVIRDAIDFAFPSPHESRKIAVGRFLAFDTSDRDDLDDTSWAETRAAMEAELEGRFG